MFADTKPPLAAVYENHTVLRLVAIHVDTGSVAPGLALVVFSVVVEPSETTVAFAHPPLPPAVGTAVLVAVAVATITGVRVGVWVRVGGMLGGVIATVAVLVGVGVNVAPGVQLGNAVWVGDCAYTGARLSSNMAAGTSHNQDHLRPLVAVLLRSLVALHI